MQSVVFAGLDYHQNKVQVCLMNGEGKVLKNQSYENDWRAIAQSLPGVSQVRAAMEVCSGAAALADQLSEHAGWKVELAHPGLVSRMRLNRDKSDYSDARVLADIQRVGYLPRVWLAPPFIRELRTVVGFRHQLRDQRRAVKLRIRALLREQRAFAPGLNAWTQPWMEWLKNQAPLSPQTRWVMNSHLRQLEFVCREIATAEQQLKNITAEDPLVRRLMTLPGIGLITACTMRASIGRFDRFGSGKQLASFCGVSPRNASSGERQADAGLNDACNKNLRTVVIEAAHRLIRTQPRWAKMARQLHGRGKPKSLAAAAVANRWIRWLFHQFKPLGLGLAERT